MARVGEAARVAVRGIMDEVEPRLPRLLSAIGCWDWEPQMPETVIGPPSPRLRRGEGAESGGQKSAEIVRTQAGSFHDALERPNRDRFVAVPSDDDLPAAQLPPLLMTSFLPDLRKATLSQNAKHIFGCANWEALAQVSATSTTFVPAGKLTSDGSNQSANASFALRTASSSLSPAEAQPGSSGKNAAQRFVCGSCSTTSRSFIATTVRLHVIDGKHQ